MAASPGVWVGIGSDELIRAEGFVGDTSLLPHPPIKAVTRKTTGRNFKVFERIGFFKVTSPEQNLNLIFSHEIQDWAQCKEHASRPRSPGTQPEAVMMTPAGLLNVPGSASSSGLHNQNGLRNSGSSDQPEVSPPPVEAYRFYGERIKTRFFTLILISRDGGAPPQAKKTLSP
jgi:hypothetical protein